MPEYYVNLFVDGISEAIGGNACGLVDAIGYSMAANTALSLQRSSAGHRRY
jgi:hypothetical protein